MNNWSTMPLLPCGAGLPVSVSVGGMNLPAVS
jgi:hypothetical protein